MANAGVTTTFFYQIHESERPSKGGPSAPLRLSLRSPLPSPLVSCGCRETEETLLSFSSSSFSSGLLAKPSL
ncbi:hypothetical protein B296_00051733 [Ensete ventricosum]|uniref:Uncharacterized protein n=1 Tax=Ensete ventricosum TaxID=4639 RepID=A0A426X3Z2_ENSVE|nr:hypothetical protein B296_00051733 [Ensete ventricosum]